MARHVCLELFFLLCIDMGKFSTQIFITELEPQILVIFILISCPLKITFGVSKSAAVDHSYIPWDWNITTTRQFVELFSFHYRSSDLPYTVPELVSLSRGVKIMLRTSSVRSYKARFCCAEYNGPPGSVRCLRRLKPKRGRGQPCSWEFLGLTLQRKPEILISAFTLRSKFQFQGPHMYQYLAGCAD